MPAHRVASSKDSQGTEGCKSSCQVAQLSLSTFKVAGDYRSQSLVCCNQTSARCLESSPWFMSCQSEPSIT